MPGKFQIIIVIRVVLIILTTGLFFLALKNPDHLFSIALTASLVIVQAIWLVRHVTQVNRTLDQVFQSVLNQDGTVHVLPGESKLNKTLQEVTAHLSNLQKEKQVQYHYLKLIVNHLNTGIIAYSSDGRIDMVNQSALKLLGLKKLKHLEELKHYGEDFMQRIWNPSITGDDFTELRRNDGIVKFSLRSSMFRLNGQTIHLCSFHNIKEELERHEIQSWKKLLRVITHEIMNSVSPIVSLTTTLNRLYVRNGKQLQPDEVEKHHIRDTVEGLQIIQRRGSGLLNFVKDIRKMHLLAEPEKSKIGVRKLFDGIIRLMEEEIQKAEVSIHTNVIPEHLHIFADRGMIEQVLLNLIKNALEAIDHGAGQIELKAFQDEGSGKYIQVTDNGKGIDISQQQEVFIPFFTTKAEGSGIGLSLSQQIMKAHQGRISVHSTPAGDTRFTLCFLT
jgi:nitrogen fixation/metabolism regulation signal transduction histidine kinase